MSRSMVVVAIGAMALPAAAIATVYADRSTFLAAVAPAATITFDGIIGTPGFAPYTPGGYFSASGYSLNGVSFTGAFPSFPSYIFDPISSFSFAGSAGGMFDQFGGVFGLTPGYTGFGVDLASVAGGGNLQITVDRVGASQITTNFAITAASKFFGYLGSEAITSVRINDPANVAFYVKFDNVSFGNAAVGAIPEPGTWALLLTGFTLTGAVARRRRGGRAVAA